MKDTKELKSVYYIPENLSSGLECLIHQTVDKCGICQDTSTAQRKLPSVPSAPHAWNTLGTDLFYWKHFDFLVLGNYFTKFLIVRKLLSSTSSAVCKEIPNILTEFGKPYIIRSDNGPCYASKEFKELMELFQVQQVTSSPHFPQSNGFAEAMVKIAKKLTDHSTLQEKAWNFGLMEYRCTPLMGNIPSPLELLTGQKHSTGLPSIPRGNSTRREYHEALIRKQQMDISEELSISTYEPGQTVLCFDTLEKIWKPAVILEPAPKPHSYWCRMANSNQKLRRTLLHIKPHLNTTECEEKQMLLSTKMEENHTFQFTPAVNRNEFLQIHLFQIYHLKFLTDHQQLGKMKLLPLQWNH